MAVTEPYPDIAARWVPGPVSDCHHFPAHFRAVTESINQLITLCTQQAPGQKECDNALRELEVRLCPSHLWRWPPSYLLSCCPVVQETRHLHGSSVILEKYLNLS